MWNRIQTIITGLVLFLVSQILFANSNTEMSRLAEKAPESLLMDIERLSSGRLVAVGERGHIIISDDDAKSWKQIQIPTDVLLTKLFFVNDQIGWTVGHQQTILKTEDAGMSWQLQNQSDNLEQPALFDIWFANEDKGIAVGAYGLYLATDDGGASWQEMYQESLEDPEFGFPHFYSLAFERKSNKIFMAGELGFLAVSNDQGETWEKLESPYQGSFFHVTALPNGTILAMGLRGHLFRSTDSGLNWELVETGTLSGLQSLLVSDKKNKLLIVGSNGSQLLSDDNAKTVRLIQRSDRVHLSGATLTSDDEILLIGVKGVISAQLN